MAKGSHCADSAQKLPDPPARGFNARLPKAKTLRTAGHCYCLWCFFLSGNGKNDIEMHVHRTSKLWNRSNAHKDRFEDLVQGNVDHDSHDGKPVARQHAIGGEHGVHDVRCHPGPMLAAVQVAPDRLDVDSDSCHPILPAVGLPLAAAQAPDQQQQARTPGQAAMAQAAPPTPSLV